MGPRLVQGMVVVVALCALGLLLLPGCGSVLGPGDIPPTVSGDLSPEDALTKQEGAEVSPEVSATVETGVSGDTGPLDRVLRLIADPIRNLRNRGMLLLLFGLVIVFVALLIALLLRPHEGKSRGTGHPHPGARERTAQNAGSGTRELTPAQLEPSLILQTVTSETRIFPFTADGLTIGREPDNDLVIDESAPRSDTVSRHHARIFYELGHWVVEDLESQNGVYVNGRRTGRNALQDGWTLGIGGVQLVFHAGTGEAPR